MAEKRHRWMAIVPYEGHGRGRAPPNHRRGSPERVPPTLLARDEAPAPDDKRPFLGLHNVVRELMTVGCYDCEQPYTPGVAAQPCPGEPHPGAQAVEGSNIPAGTFGGVGRNEPCPCGSGAKFKRCHGAR